MSSALRPGGSTSRWRRIRRRILERDGWRCQVPVEFGALCLKPATDCGHIVARYLWPPGVPGVDGDDNLRAECATHNRGQSARIRRLGRIPHYRREV